MPLASIDQLSDDSPQKTRNGPTDPPPALPAPKATTRRGRPPKAEGGKSTKALKRPAAAIKTPNEKDKMENKEGETEENEETGFETPSSPSRKTPALSSPSKATPSGKSSEIHVQGLKRPGARMQTKQIVKRPATKSKAEAAPKENEPKEKKLSAEKEPKEKKLSVYAYMYKSGVWGVKLNGKEKIRATRQHDTMY